MKIQMESLLNGKTIEVNFDEQIVFSHLAQDESAVWSLLVAGGYLKVEDVDAMNYCMNKITSLTPVLAMMISVCLTTAQPFRWC